MGVSEEVGVQKGTAQGDEGDREQENEHDRLEVGFNKAPHEAAGTSTRV